MKWECTNCGEEFESEQFSKEDKERIRKFDLEIELLRSFRTD